MKLKESSVKRKYVFYNTQEPGLAKTFSNTTLKGGWKKVCFHGGTVELDDDQFDHIMSRSTPIHDYINDPLTGSLHAQKIGDDPRFNLRLVR